MEEKWRDRSQGLHGRASRFYARFSVAVSVPFSLREKVPVRAAEGAVIAGMSPHLTLRTTLSQGERGWFLIFQDFQSCFEPMH